MWIAPTTQRTSDVAALSATTAQMPTLPQQADEHVSSADDVSVPVASQVIMRII